MDKAESSTIELVIRGATPEYLAELKKRLQPLGLQEDERPRAALEIVEYAIALTAHSVLLFNELRRIRDDLSERRQTRVEVRTLNGKKSADVGSAADAELQEISI
jgi:hypothetical protein